MKNISIDVFDVSSIDKAIDTVNKVKDSVSKNGLRSILTELIGLGCQYARIKYAAAWYDGVNDVTVNPLDDGEFGDTTASMTISASGEAVLFIEFGTGVYYPDNKNVRSIVTSGDVLNRGEYGKGRGKQMTWVYIDTEGEKVFTHGNPSNACMYDTRKYLEERLVSVAKEVIRW